MPLGSKMAPPLGSLAPIDLQWCHGKIIKKSSSPKPQGPELSYFVYSGPLYKSCQSCPLGQKGPTLGVISSHRLTNGINIKTSSPKPQGPEHFYRV